MEQKTIYDPDLERSATVQSLLDDMADLRSGHKTVMLAGTSDYEPVPVKDCVVCKHPSPMTEFGQFLCRSCVMVFS